MRPHLVLALLLVAACSRKEPAPDTSDAAVAALTAPPKAFGAPCVEDAECAGAVCFHKRVKGDHAAREQRDAEGEAVERDGYCSIRCRDDAECPVPPTRGKCGARGMCKRPE